MSHWILLVINISDNIVYVLNPVKHDVSGLHIQNLLNIYVLLFFINKILIYTTYLYTPMLIKFVGYYGIIG
jgi:hypothetical protein